MVRTLMAMIVVLASAVGAWAADAVRPGKVELYPTWTAVGIEAAYADDSNQNAAVSFVWRKPGEASWRNGAEMVIDRKRRQAWGSVWPLEPGETVEVELTFQDADAPGLKPFREMVRTRSLVLEPVGGRHFFVSPSGDDAQPGTREKPFRTLGHAARQVRPGDRVSAFAGVYAEGDLFQRLKGTADRPILFDAVSDQKPILDSSRHLPKEHPGWKAVGGDLYQTSIDASRPIGYMAQDGLRMFRYGSLAELRSDKAKARRAWFHDEKGRSLYVRTGTGRPPADHGYHVSTQDYALYLDGSQHVLVRGFEMRHYGASGVRLSGGARGCVIADCVIHNVPGGFFLKNDTTQDIAIWRNEIHEAGLNDFSWGAIKGSEYARQGIFFSAGRGISICHNRIHGWFDCVCPESWKNPDKLELNRDCDVMFNELYNAGDDAIEADGGGVNMRLHGNRIRNCLTALSLAPIERGPVYVTRNDATFRGLMFKLNVGGCTSLGWTYCYHNSGYCQTTGADGGTAISFPPGIPCANKVFKNNVVICNEWSVRAGGEKRNYVLDGNCYYHVPGKPPRRFQWDKKAFATIEAFRQATSQEAHGLYADPLFEASPDLGKYAAPPDFLASCLSDHPLARDIRTGDLRLRAGSPCIDRGVLIRGINDDFRGKAPDIGAFETGSPGRRKDDG